MTNISQQPLWTGLESFAPQFENGFLQDHAGRILTDPKIAIVELIANAWDAGADCVDVVWPNDFQSDFIIADNGTGMTFEEFKRRWSKLKYNRLLEQGYEVEFPQGNRSSNRKAFGRNGKGRHAMFCFSNSYIVETWKNGTKNTFKVEIAVDDSSTPFNVVHVEKSVKSGHGTIIRSTPSFSPLSVQGIRELIGSKFISDPAFTILVNGEPVKLTDIESLTKVHILTVDGLGEIIIRHIQSETGGRTSKQNGVAWWVQKRLVGEPSWHGFDDIPYLDARRTQARYHTFIVEADIIASSVKEDWSDFLGTDDFYAVHKKVKEFIKAELNELMQDVYRERKENAIIANQQELKELSISSRYAVGTFLDEIQKTLPTIGEKELNATVDVLSKLEKSRSGFVLIERLARLSPDDLDGLNHLLSTWTVREATIVLDELQKRLKLIEKLEELVENHTTDELHGLQPLFDVGLWIFGPEYEGVSFTSNKTLRTVIEKFFGDQIIQPLQNERKRPDFIVIPDATISLYSRDAYDERGEVDGIDKLLIIEIKKGGFEITRKERAQAQDYASEIRKSGKVRDRTIITGFVLGASIASDAVTEVIEGKTVIYPRTYSTVIHQAHARTFHLLQKLNEATKDTQLFDADVERIINQPVQIDFLK